MKAIKAGVWVVGFIFFSLSLATFISFERKAKVIEELESMLNSLLNNATEIIQKGPPPKGMRVVGIYKRNYGDSSILDVTAAIGVWDGLTFIHTCDSDKSFRYAIDYQYPDEWVPYPVKKE